MATRSQNLAIDFKLAAEFLAELVNLPLDAPGPVTAFVKRFADFGLFEPKVIRAKVGGGSPRAAVEQTVVPYLHHFFRAVWIEPDAKIREWGVVIFRAEWTNMRLPDLGLSLRDEGGLKRLPAPPEETGVEKALDYLRRLHHITRYCPNADCPAPYFFARRHSQRYCSPECAQIAEKATKRRWWSESGVAWRKKRKKASSKAGKAPRTATKKGRKARN